jgi:SAM-dependent methyltransferase
MQHSSQDPDLHLKEQLFALLAADEYIRERVAPFFGDEYYLHLSDLLDAIKLLANFRAPRVLDYGSGGAPYRKLFTGTYIRADLASNPQAELHFDGEGNLPDVDLFDQVLSTQVLEHVSDPIRYLSECKRVLKKNGILVLTTHGLFEDHSCPADYWRWTANGLRRLIEEQGFRVEKALKITTNPRASLFALQRDLARLGVGARRAIIPFCFRLLREVGMERINRYADRNLADYRVVADDIPGHERYVAIGIRAISL